MAVFYRAGKLPTAADLANDSAVWFDSVSSDYLRIHPHVGRTSSVFMTPFQEDVYMWRDRRIAMGYDDSIWEVTVSDEIPVNMYRYRHYDMAFCAKDDYALASFRNEGVRFSQFVRMYWNSGVEVNHFLKMWSRCMGVMMTRRIGKLKFL